MNRTMLLLSFFLLCIASASYAQKADTSEDTSHIILREHKENLFRQYLKIRQAENMTEVQSNFDALFYRLDLTVEYDPDLLTGIVTGRFASTTDQLASVILNMDDRLNIGEVSGNVSQFVHRQQRLEIELDRAYSLGEEFEITVSYDGVPAAGTGYNYFRFDEMDDGSPHVWTLSEPYGARYWWPCKDTPGDKPDSVDIVVTVPAGQLVASNGTLVQITDNADATTTFYWQERYPIATYLVSLAIGNYAWFQDFYVDSNQDTLLLDYYVYPSDLAEARSVFREMHDYMDAMIHFFGPYPFEEEKYGMAQFGWGGGMEHQTITSIGNVSENWRYLYVHELAHQWFGDMITMDSWQEIWLNEGFASYAEALYAEWAGFRGNPPGMDSYHAYINTQQYLNGGTIWREDTTSFGSLFNRIVYDKGSWVLHMLRGIVGDETFFSILRTYLSDTRWQYASASTDNFKEICETVSGRKFDAFFDQWLNYPYFPEYGYSWDIVEQTEIGYSVEVVILQQQDRILYEMPVDLRFEFLSGNDTTVTVMNDRQEQFYLFRFAEEPVRLRFDPDNWILKQVDSIIDAEFTADIIIEEFYPNPFNEEVTINVRNWHFEEITLEVFDITGKKLRVLEPVNSAMDHTYEFRWDGTNESGVRVASGTYFVVPAGENTNTAHARKLIKLR